MKAGVTAFILPYIEEGVGPNRCGSALGPFGPAYRMQMSVSFSITHGQEHGMKDRPG
ncbi:hypothetical protein [Pseudomonas sp. UFMG81]|uniref:hypothetical protein n=1 Tax=Pseudomonas sp. UFMG81 TaxID=2745936 RepID=UPI00188F537E|nr:hypothetical protein [Pseudomonas sp. UFMG81]